jgi:putative ABC transport system permease protein
VQELFAILGIAAGVALLFASQVASQSLRSSVAELSHGITGQAKLQLLARDTGGMEAAMVAKVRKIRGVRVAAPLLEASAEAEGPRGKESVELVGADASLRELNGELTRRTELEPFGGIGAVVMPGPLAKHLGVERFGNEVTLKLFGRAERAPLYEQLGEGQIGGLVHSPVVVAPLFYAQELAGLRGRVSRILVEPAPGKEGTVRNALEHLAAGRLNVEETSYDERLFSKAAEASNQSTTLFAVISAMVGFLFAFNAMLLTVAQRRRLIGDLRRDGFAPKTVIGVLLLDALALGIVACVLGLVLGDELSVHLFKENPGYLGSAFSVGTQRTVGVQSVGIAIAGGMGAALVAVLSPLRDIVSRDPLAAITPKEGGRSAGASRRTWAAVVACLGAATAILLATPKLAILGMVLLVGALVLILPVALTLSLRSLAWVARRRTGAVGHVAGMELSAAKGRAIGVAATGAIAVFGAVAIQGAHTDLLKGLENAAHDENAFTDIWVAPPGGYNLLRTAPFSNGQQTAIEHVPGVAAVRIYRGGLLNWGERKVWIIAPSFEAAKQKTIRRCLGACTRNTEAGGTGSAVLDYRDPLPASQILEGATQTATGRLREGGWVVVSKALAEEHRLTVGDAFTLPSPVPRTFRVAAESTNIGWAPGAITMTAEDYGAAWGSEAVSGYNVLLGQGAPGESGEPLGHIGGESQKVGIEQFRQQVAARIRRALGPSSGLAVETAGEHEEEQNRLSKQGLKRLSAIATLILVAAVLAMGAAIGSMVWQRRGRLAKLKLEGFPRAELWRTILLESTILVGVGSLTGAAFGLYGEQLLDRALANVINFPVVESVAGLPALVSLGIVTGAALAIVSIPGYAAAGVSPAVALED